jgi:hypothetical protein
MTSNDFQLIYDKILEIKNSSRINMTKDTDYDEGVQVGLTKALLVVVDVAFENGVELKYGRY